MASILIVDDEIDARDALCTYLEKFGHVVTCVESGQEAMRAILDASPDVMVLDLLMPGMDGPTLLAIVRSYLRLHRIPVVVWTGAGPGPIVESARDIGVSSILFKPGASFPDIRAAVEQAAAAGPRDKGD